MEILADGYFAGETKDLERPIGFRLHGYAPLDLELKGKEGELVDVGTLHLTPLPASRLGALTGKLSFLGLADPTKVEVLISVMGGPVNTPNGSSSPRPHSPWPVHQVRVDAEGRISATGFTPIKYWCRIKGPDVVEKQFPVSFTEGQTLDVGTLQVERAKPFEVTYVVAEKRPFDLSQKKEITLRCTAFGTSKLKATADPLRIDLMFEQRNGALFFRSIGARSGLTDLGIGSLEKFVNADPGAGSKPDDVPVRNGHVYLLNHPLWNYQVLFRIELETPASGAEVGSPLPVAETGPPLRWHARTSPVPMQFLFGIASSPDHFVAVGFNDNQVLHCSDGANWTAQRLPEGQRPNHISFANGRFLFLTHAPESALFQSANGAEWKPIQPHDIPTNAVVRFFGYGDGLYLGAGFSQVVWSEDLQHWTAGSGVPRGYIHTLTHANGRWVGARDGGVITSRDGKSWHAVNLADKVSFFGVAYGAGHFVVVGYGGRIVSSADGEHWDQVHEGTDARQGLFGVAFGGDRFVACGFDGAILVSSDGRTWTQSESGTHTILRRVAFGQGRFVIVGDQGTILQSDPVP
jgi:photosystem II stability/assembly factor-like uncharacterized protein